MTTLVGEELEQQEMFWQTASKLFEEAEDDEDFESDSEEDVVDSDFDAPEEVVDEASAIAAREAEVQRQEKEEESENRKRKKSAYVDAAAARKRQAAAAARRTQRAAASEPAEQDGVPSGAGVGGTEVAPRVARSRSAPRSPVTPTERKTLRASTQQKTRAAQEQREAMQDADDERRHHRRRRRTHMRPLTREELLAEAEVTEASNTASLARLTALEQERKNKRAAVAPKQPEGPRYVVRSRLVDGMPETTLAFRNVPDLPSDPAAVYSLYLCG